MPMTFDASDEELSVFLQEADEQLELLQNDTIRLEKEYADEGLVQGIFRAAHTLKGSSALIGHTRMAELTHAMENVLDLVRKGKLVPTADLIDRLLLALDALKLLREEIDTREPSDVELEPVLTALHAAASAPAEQVAAAPQSAAAPTPADATPDPGGLHLSDEERQVLKDRIESGEPAWLVQVGFAPDSVWLAVRACQVLTGLEQLGSIVKSQPAADALEDATPVAQVVAILVGPDAKEPVEAAIAQVDEVASSRITRLEAGSIAPAQPSEGDEPHPMPTEQRSTTEPTATPGGQERRIIDVGPEGRGKAPQELLALAAQKIDKLSQNIRVDVERLDNLLNLVGELVIGRNRFHQLGMQLRAKLGNDEALEALTGATQDVANITNQLQAEVMRIRMMPIESVFNKFPRMVRGLAQKLDKKVELVLEGKETELDRSVIEKIDDPLIHLLRNSLDHGIEPPEERLAAGKPETGNIRLAAWHAENHIVIAVEDDGRGIDAEKLKATAIKKGLITPEVAARMDEQAALELIFAPGFSTAAKTTEVSGRGVGMDIVRSNVEKLNGTVMVETTPGQGTRFLVKLPLTLAIIRALLVTVGKQKFAIPMTSVIETIRLDQTALKPLQQRKATELRGQVLPLLSLGELLAPQDASSQSQPIPLKTRGRKRKGSKTEVATPAQQKPGKLLVVAVHAGKRQVGLQVDSFVGQTDIVIKPLTGLLDGLPGISGVTILGDGRLAVICDVPALLANKLELQEAA